MPEAYEDYLYCETYEPTPEEIQWYRNEEDFDMRIQLAYEYNITQDDLYPEDFKYIMEDVEAGMMEFLNDL